MIVKKGKEKRKKKISIFPVYEWKIEVRNDTSHFLTSVHFFETKLVLVDHHKSTILIVNYFENCYALFYLYRTL